MGNSRIQELLNFRFKAKYFKEKGVDLLDGKTVVRNIHKLEQATEDLVDLQSRACAFDLQKTRDILEKAFRDDVKPEKVLIDGRSLRGYSYNIVPGSYAYNKFVLAVFKSNWSASFISGLIHSILNSWIEYDEEERKLLVDFLTSQIKSCKSYTSDVIKNALPYLSDNGAYKLGHSIKKQEKSIFECCQVFFLPRNRFVYSYFSDVIAGYYGDNPSVDFEELKKVLKSHNNIAATKKVLPLVIITYDRKKQVSKDLVRIAVEMIGDPFVQSKWAPFKGANREDEQNLQKARQILVSAISAEFINVFFKTLTDDPRRLDFWLNITKYISDFRVFGSSYSRSLMGGKVEFNILNKHYSTTTNNQDTCALVMVIKEYAIIEFTDVGALYVYKNTNNMYKSIMEDRCRVDKMDDLKIPEIGKLVDDTAGYFHYYPEGKMVHRGNWERRMENWLNRIALK